MKIKFSKMLLLNRALAQRQLWNFQNDPRSQQVTVEFQSQQSILKIATNHRRVSILTEHFESIVGKESTSPPPFCSNKVLEFPERLQMQHVTVELKLNPDRAWWKLSFPTFASQPCSCSKAALKFPKRPEITTSHRRVTILTEHLGNTVFQQIAL